MSTIGYKKQNFETELIPLSRSLNSKKMEILAYVKGLPIKKLEISHTVGTGQGIENKFNKESAKFFFTNFNQQLLDKILLVKEEKKLWSL